MTAAVMLSMGKLAVNVSLETFGKLAGRNLRIADPYKHPESMPASPP
jgi:hypothetical protein